MVFQTKLFFKRDLRKSSSKCVLTLLQVLQVVELEMVEVLRMITARSEQDDLSVDQFDERVEIAAIMFVQFVTEYVQRPFAVPNRLLVLGEQLAADAQLLLD